MFVLSFIKNKIVLVVS